MYFRSLKWRKFRNICTDILYLSITVKGRVNILKMNVLANDMFLKYTSNKFSGN